MQIELYKLPENTIGIYGKDGKTMPWRLRMLQKEAAEAFIKLYKDGYQVIVSDMYRTPESSMIARLKKSGVQKPGYSMHNYGLAIDIDYAQCMKNFKMNKKQLDELMKLYEFYCHRTDGLLKSEAWHYSFGIKEFLNSKEQTTQYASERKMMHLYGKDFDLTNKSVQEKLKLLKFYQGDIDGIIGPRSLMAIKLFKNAWNIKNEEGLGKITKRTLAIVCAEVIVKDDLINSF